MKTGTNSKRSRVVVRGEYQSQRETVKDNNENTHDIAFPGTTAATGL